MTTASLPRADSKAQSAAAWWRGAVIYHIYPLSFADSNDDGYGDLPGITKHLDYVKSLGADAIWISPFYTSPMRDFGYDIADYCNVDPRFGAPSDFDALIKKAHALGLKVIVDQVYSHTSDQHAWFKDSRRDRTNAKADWYVWADAKPDGSPPSNWQSVFTGPAWTWDARRRQYYLHNFLPEQPDLNVRHPQVQEALLDVARFWLDRGVDGFRLDAINFAMHDPSLRDNPPVTGDSKRERPFDFQHHFYNQSHPDIPAFLERVRTLADEYGATFLVAEVGGEQADQEMKCYTQHNNRLHSAYSFKFLYASELTPALVRASVQAWPGEEGEGWPAWAFSNHDAPRVVSRWAHNVDEAALAKQALLLLVCLRGSVFVYQGEELGLPQSNVPQEFLRDPEALANWPHTLGRDGARTPMPWRANQPHSGFSRVTPWLPVDPAHDALAVDVQDANAASTLNFARRVIGMRQGLEALRGGDIAFLPSSDPVLAFTRGAGAKQILCAFNLSSHPAAWVLPMGWEITENANAPGALNAELPPLAGIVARRR